MKLSVVICTYNRSDEIDKTLKLLRYNSCCEEVEILVIDNGSSDRTEDVVSSNMENDSRIRLIREDRLGLSSARNRGIVESTGDIVCFLDDDVNVGDGILDELVEVFRDSSVVACGGRITPVWGIADVDWISSRMMKVYSLLDLGNIDREFSGNEFPVGANMTFRRVVFENGIKFNERLGRVGELLLSHEEVELFRAIMNKGRFVYAHKVHVEHRIPAERCQKTWFYKRWYWSGVSDYVAYGYTMKFLGKVFVKVIIAILLFLVFWDRRLRTEGVARVYNVLGFFRGRFEV